MKSRISWRDLFESTHDTVFRWPNEVVKNFRLMQNVLIHKTTCLGTHNWCFASILCRKNSGFLGIFGKRTSSWQGVWVRDHFYVWLCALGCIKTCAIDRSRCVDISRYQVFCLTPSERREILNIMTNLFPEKIGHDNTRNSNFKSLISVM